MLIINLHKNKQSIQNCIVNLFCSKYFPLKKIYANRYSTKLNHLDAVFFTWNINLFVP